MSKASEFNEKLDLTEAFVKKASNGMKYGYLNKSGTGVVASEDAGLWPIKAATYKLIGSKFPNVFLQMDPNWRGQTPEPLWMVIAFNKNIDSTIKGISESEDDKIFIKNYIKEEGK